MTPTIDFDYSGSPVSKTLSNGTYRFRLWGAQGGFVTNTSSGLGSYSEGLFRCYKDTTIYAYVGGKGNCYSFSKQSTQFGGGSNAIGVENDISCVGGEATFIYLENNPQKLLIVAGAGGGSGMWTRNDINNIREFSGGYGGQIAGIAMGNELTPNLDVSGKGATINSPGKGGFYYAWNSYQTVTCQAENGKFLKGGNACSSAKGSSGGGGSGYYGGGGGADVAGGGGGSSFASSLMKNSILMNGNMIFESPTGEAERGHQGDGFIVIEEVKDEIKLYNSCEIKN